MQNPIDLIDGTIIIVYFLLVLAIGLTMRQSDKNVHDYFLSGKRLGWFAVGVSLFITNISSEHIIGLAGSGAVRGLAVAQFELMAIFFLIILGWFIAPLYRDANVLTTPEYLGKRFNETNRKFYSALSIFTYILTKILVTLFAGGILLNKLFGLSIFTSSIIIILLTGVYTLVGGFTAVIRTQLFQGILTIIGAALVLFFGLHQVGGFEGLRDKLPLEHFQMFKSANDPDFPWTGIVFGAPIIAFWYWCADHYIVQRILGAKSIEHARAGTMLASLFKILPLFVLVLPGLIAIALFPNVRGDEAFPALVYSDLLPVGIKGIVIAGFLAAMMSSLSAAFNSIAALYTIDFYKSNHADASERTLVLVGRMATIVAVFVVLLIVPFIKIMNSTIYIFLQSTQAFISAPISAVFILGFTLKRVNAKSVFAAFIVGEAIGLSRFFLEFAANAGLVSNPLLLAITKFNYLHFTIFLFIGTSVLLLSLSYLFGYGSEAGSNQKISLFAGSSYAGGKSIMQLPKVRVQAIISFAILLLTLGLWYLFI